MDTLKLYIVKDKSPYIGFVNKNESDIRKFLDYQKNNVQDLQKPKVLYVRNETGVIVIAVGNEYSLHWTAKELMQPYFKQRVDIGDFTVYRVPPKFTISLSSPSFLNPEFCTEVMRNIIQRNNRSNLNSIDRCAFVRNGEANHYQRFYISADIRTLFQLMKRKYIISLGSIETKLELIGIGFSGVIYGVSDGFQAIFSSFNYPYALLYQDDVQKLAYHIHDKKQMIGQKDRLPVVNSIILKNGRIVLECPNQFSLNWVIEIHLELEMESDASRFGLESIKLDFEASEVDQ